jgi:hypothetical protein
MQTIPLSLDILAKATTIEVVRHHFGSGFIIRITFRNGHALSLLDGSMFKCDGDGTNFEVGVFNSEKEPVTQLSYCSVEQLNKIALEVSGIG